MCMLKSTNKFFFGLSTKTNLNIINLKFFSLLQFYLNVLNAFIILKYILYKNTISKYKRLCNKIKKVISKIKLIYVYLGCF